MEKAKRKFQSIEGAETLSKINDKFKTADYVERAAERAEHRGEKIGNSEQKIGAYILRLEKITKTKNGERREQGERRIKEATLDALTVNIDEIPESYWAQQEELARENGRIVEIDDNLKHQLHEKIAEDQRRSAEKWIDYLDNENNYPTWFKVFALDGMSQMGIFDKEKANFRKRSQGTVAPYPNLNPAVLAKTYDVMNRHYVDGESLQPNEVVAKGGNFNKIYSRFLVEETQNLRAPENFEDVKGEWRQYFPGQEEQLMAAAQGTPWCIAGETMACSYLSRDNDSFYLFHLQNPDTGVVSETANASIRMADGEVAEISGIEQGSSQILEDSLVPAVEEKVKTLPGGEEYLEYLEEAKYLKKIDNLAREGKLGGLPEDELDEAFDFIFSEHNYKIESDDRLQYIKDFSYLLHIGFPAEKVFEKDPYPGRYLRDYINVGIPAEKVFKKDPDPVSNFSTYVENGILAKELFEVDNFPEARFDSYIKHGVSAKEIFNKCSTIHYQRQDMFMKYVENGVLPEEVFDKLAEFDRPDIRELLFESTIPIENILAKEKYLKRRDAELYLKSGVPITDIFDKAGDLTRRDDVEFYLENGIPIEDVYSHDYCLCNNDDIYLKYLEKEELHDLEGPKDSQVLIEVVE